MRDRFFMLAEEAVPNGWTTEGYCKAGGFTSRSLITEAVFGKSCRVLVIYLMKFRKKIKLFHMLMNDSGLSVIITL